MEKLLITGMAGGLANLVADALADRYEIVGVDFRPYPKSWGYSGKFLRVDYTKRAFADIFREHRFDKVLHLGRIGNPLEKFYKRYNFNVLGTSNILGLCDKYQVRTIIVFSTFHIYGAHQFNPVNIEEGHPLRAAQIFRELLDAVELDNLATSHLWKNRTTRTVILRPCNIVGAQIHNAISQFLRQKYIPYLIGFDPMMQFVHERDMCRAVVLALENEGVYGVYNVAGAGALPYRHAIRIAGGRGIPIPHSLLYAMFDQLSRWGVGVPAHLVDYFRYPVIISDRKFRQDSGYKPELGMEETLRQIHPESPC